MVSDSKQKAAYFTVLSARPSFSSWILFQVGSIKTHYVAKGDEHRILWDAVPAVMLSGDYKVDR